MNNIRVPGNALQEEAEKNEEFLVRIQFRRYEKNGILFWNMVMNPFVKDYPYSMITDPTPVDVFYSGFPVDGFPFDYRDLPFNGEAMETVFSDELQLCQLEGTIRWYRIPERIYNYYLYLLNIGHFIYLNGISPPLKSAWGQKEARDSLLSMLYADRDMSVEMAELLLGSYPYDRISGRVGLRSCRRHLRRISVGGSRAISAEFLGKDRS